MRHDVSLTMCFHTLWCRLYQTSEFSRQAVAPAPEPVRWPRWPLAAPRGRAGARRAGPEVSEPAWVCAVVFRYGIRYS